MSVCYTTFYVLTVGRTCDSKESHNKTKKIPAGVEGASRWGMDEGGHEQGKTKQGRAQRVHYAPVHTNISHVMKLLATLEVCSQ